MRALALVVVLVALPACERRRPSHDGPIDAPALFQRYCAPCHGADGRGNASAGIPDLTAEATRGKSDEALRHRVHFGAGRMPPFGSALDDEQIAALVAHVRALR